MKPYSAVIHIGFKEKYSLKEHSIDSVYDFCFEYVNEYPDCVNIKSCRFVYTGGFEEGCSIEFIQYPRFKRQQQEIKRKALTLAKALKEKLNQFRVTVVCSDEVIML